MGTIVNYYEAFVRRFSTMLITVPELTVIF
jgi:hypothetical protein